MKLSIADDFTPTPGGRFRKHGPFSGEEFRDDLLEPRFAAAVSSQDKLVIIFDGVAGLPSSFLEEAFGGFVRRHLDLTLAQIKKVLAFETKEPSLDVYVDLADRYMDEAYKKRQYAAQ